MPGRCRADAGPTPSPMPGRCRADADADADAIADADAGPTPSPMPGRCRADAIADAGPMPGRCRADAIADAGPMPGRCRCQKKQLRPRNGAPIYRGRAMPPAFWGNAPRHEKGKQNANASYNEKPQRENRAYPGKHNRCAILPDSLSFQFWWRLLCRKRAACIALAESIGKPRWRYNGRFS
jgi:hypothetical protein